LLILPHHDLSVPVQQVERGEGEGAEGRGREEEREFLPWTTHQEEGGRPSGDEEEQVCGAGEDTIARWRCFGFSALLSWRAQFLILIQSPRYEI
jgi:hypothetical protein